MAFDMEQEDVQQLRQKYEGVNPSAEEVLEDAGAFDPEKDSLPVTNAETNYALKARRYVDSLLSRDHLKINDLSDQASMHLASQRSDGEVLDHGEAAEKIVEYTSAQFPPYEVLDGEKKAEQVGEGGPGKSRSTHRYG